MSTLVLKLATRTKVLHLIYVEKMCAESLRCWSKKKKCVDFGVPMEEPETKFAQCTVTTSHVTSENCTSTSAAAH